MYEFLEAEGSGYTIRLMRLSCRTFPANAIRLQLHVLAYNLDNFLRTPALPKPAEAWSLTSLREKLIKISAKVVSHGRYVTFQMAGVGVPRQMFAEILSLTARLRAPPLPARRVGESECEAMRREGMPRYGQIDACHCFGCHQSSASIASCSHWARFALPQDGQRAILASKAPAGECRII